MRKTQRRTGQSQKDIILIPDIPENGENVDFLNAYSKCDIFRCIVYNLYNVFIKILKL